MLVKNPGVYSIPFLTAIVTRGLWTCPVSLIASFATGTWLSTATLQTIQPTGLWFQWSGVADGWWFFFDRKSWWKMKSFWRKRTKRRVGFGRFFKVDGHFKITTCVPPWRSEWASFTFRGSTDEWQWECFGESDLFFSEEKWVEDHLLTEGKPFFLLGVSLSCLSLRVQL